MSDAPRCRRVEADGATALVHGRGDLIQPQTETETPDE